VCPEFASTFKFPKSKGHGEFGIKYMEAAFDKDAGSGEFFFEFEDYVWSHKLVKSFETQGAGQVMTCTFANLDGGDSAANALVCVFNSQVKTNITYTRGTCTAALLTKAQAKLAEQKLSQASTKEFDEKTVAAIKHSLALQEETKAAVVKVEGSLEGVKDSMECQVVRLDGIQHGVCLVIPDYQKEIARLNSQLTHKTTLCDRIEWQKGRLTYEINKQKLQIGEGVTEKERIRIENASVLAYLHIDKQAQAKTIQDLQEKLDMSHGIAMLRQMMDETQHTTEILGQMMNENQRTTEILLSTIAKLEDTNRKRPRDE
jgi:hypothetical protein